MSKATYTVHIDWNRDGDYSDANENISAYWRSFSIQVGFQQPYTYAAGENTLELEVKNTDRRFSPDYTAGPYYANRWLQRPIRIQATDGIGTVTLFEGFTSSIQPTWNRRGEQVAIIRAVQRWEDLNRSRVYLPLLQNVTANTIISTALEQVRLAAAVSPGPFALDVIGQSELDTNTYLRDNGITTALDTGVETFPYVGDTLEHGETALNVITTAAQEEQGKVFFSRSGVLTFWNRNRLPADVTNDLTFTDSMIEADYRFGGNLVNRVTASYTPRVVSTATDDVLWTLDEPVTIKPSDDRTFNVRFTEANSDTKASALSTNIPNVGNGTLAFTSGTATITGWEPSATGVKFVLLASDATECVVSSIVITGQKVSTYNEVTLDLNDPDSEFHYGTRELKQNFKFVQEPANIESLARYRIFRQKTPRGAMYSITIVNKDVTRLGYILRNGIGDRIRITEAQTGHTSDYFVIGEHHRVEAGRIHDVTWVLEPADSTKFALLDTIGRAELNSNFILGA